MLETLRISPDYRNAGKFQFVTGYTGGGAEMCVHLTFEEVAKRLAKKHGDGELVDDGVDLIWMQPDDVATRKRMEDSLACSSL